MDNVLELKPRLNNKFIWEPMPDGCLLWCEESGQILILNPMAELILTYCDGETRLLEISANLAEEVPITQELFLKSIRRFLAEKVLLKGSA